MFVGVLMLLNVLIAIITESYIKSFTERFSLLGRARIPVLARHSYLDTAARQISEGGCTSKYYFVMTGIILSYIIFIMSFGIFLRSLILRMNDPGDEVNIYIMLGISITLFIIASISIVIVVTDCNSVVIYVAIVAIDCNIQLPPYLCTPPSPKMS